MLKNIFREFFSLALILLKKFDDFADSKFRRIVPNSDDFFLDIPPTLFHDFSNDRFVAEFSESGHRWYSLPSNHNVRVLPQIVDGALSAQDSGSYLTAAYIAADLGRNVLRVRAEISFSSGMRGGCATIIVTNRLITEESDISHIVDDGSIHIAFANNKVSVGLFKNRDFLVVKKFWLPTPLPRRGERFVVGFDISGCHLKITAPGLRSASINHRRVGELVGPYLTLGNCSGGWQKMVAR